MESASFFIGTWVDAIAKPITEPYLEPELDHMRESVIIGLKNRVLQQLALLLPGGAGIRVVLHRLRGVKIGKNVWIGSGALIETAYPSWVSIGDRVVLGIRSTILAHFQEVTGVRIENDVYIGACAVILP